MTQTMDMLLATLDFGAHCYDSIFAEETTEETREECDSTGTHFLEAWTSWGRLGRLGLLGWEGCVHYHLQVMSKRRS